MSSAALRFSLCGDSLPDVVAGGGIEFVNCLHVDPLFVIEVDYRLTVSSPCVNNGDPNTDTGLFPGGPGDPVDFDLQPRVVGPGIDMGAFERQEVVSVKNDYPETPISIYPNPASIYVVISGSETIHSITILNMAGQIVWEDLFIKRQEEINISGLADGLYILNIGLAKSQLPFKLLKTANP